MKAHCIGDAATVRGFRLAGVEGSAVRTAEEASAALSDAARREEIALVILTGRFSQAMRPQVDAMRLERDRPLIVEIPGPDGYAPGEQGLRRLVQAAVGLDLSG